MTPRARAYLTCASAYAIAIGAGAIVFATVEDDLLGAALGDAAATVVVFAFSVALANSSMYDPYWSVAPPVLLVAWLSDEISIRTWIAGALVLFWALRLTFNFLRGWQDLAHEDWRYRDLRAKTGGAYWLVSFLGIHFFPTVMTFAGSLSLYAITRPNARELNWLDAIAFAVTAGSIAIETIADEELRRFRLGKPPQAALLESGLWRYSRHPNYFGEVGFWWGLYFFALAAHPELWWTVAGPVAITLLFVFISIPMIDRRMLARRPAYRERMARVSALVPMPPRKIVPHGNPSP
jgi:steroid 5-alpha reductase family enzyme